MNDKELVQLVNSDPWTEHHFKGVFPFNSVPELNRGQEFAIVNIDNHWIVVYRENKVTLQVFNSLGSESAVKTVLRNNYSLVKDIHQVSYSTTPFQGTDSTSCGQFCVYFIVNRLRYTHESFQEILARCFSSDVDENEKRVAQFVEERERSVLRKQEALKNRSS